MSNHEVKKGFSRRDFLKSSAVGAVGLAAMGVLTACDSSAPAGAPAPEGNGAPVAASEGERIFGMCSTGDWLGKAPQIEAAAIKEVIEKDVVVVGGGHSGLLAALGAVDEGASVAVIETQPWSSFVDLKGDGTNRSGWYGEDIGHVNSKWLIGRGFGPYNTGEIAYEFVKRTMGRCDPDLIRKYVQNSGPMLDRMMEIYASMGDRRIQEDSAVVVKKELHGKDDVTVDYSDMTQYPLSVVHHQHDEDQVYPMQVGDYKTWPCNIQFYGHQGNNIEYFNKYICYYAQEHGATWYFEHTGVVLVQDAGGHVTGVIAEDLNSPGTYKQFNARQGVVMAAGDFKGNPEMCWALLNEYMEWAERSGQTVADWQYTSTRSGTGHKMMCWAGGIMETTPRGCMGKKSGPSGPWGAGPFLQLNKKGRRFHNEAGTATASGIMFRQPQGLASFVTDKKVFQTLFKGGLDHGAPNFGWKEMADAMLEGFNSIEVGNPEGTQISGVAVAESLAYMKGTVYAANTLDELADFLGYTGDAKKTFLAEVAHYNELCRSPEGDIDYGKQKNLMIPVDEAPFYGGKSELNSKPSLGLVTLAGVVADEEFRVARAGNKEDPIKGLYTCGNCLGNRYGLEYVTPMAGNSLGMAMTHGWLAGKNAAQGI